MGAYFKPLRRKIGVVTLLLACVAAVEWVRSRYYFDNLEITSSLAAKNVTCDLQSMKSQIGCNFHVYRVGDPKGSWLDFNCAAYELRIETFSDSDQLKLYVDRAGFRYGTITGTIHPDTQLVYDTIVVKAPYWSVVIPLALISAYLIFRNPRSKPLTTETTIP